uniref:5methylthioadenosine/Sadenosylhomocysteine deaminase putative n=1 Tax=Albugo laibachii Nc14 TaxID=890382 RepID=F0WSU6_9STRA|nr:5methylthioadenosine/Sadenosylhomocysteine deaminase putative [Albugo laibachii Nc14]|eukprot:CCA24424.1 5methylthioadenosine/Sadenosylhomocysteine deaminase putative [Albugo laibachii Nc14]
MSAAAGKVRVQPALSMVKEGGSQGWSMIKMKIATAGPVAERIHQMGRNMLESYIGEQEVDRIAILSHPKSTGEAFLQSFKDLHAVNSPGKKSFANNQFSTSTAANQCFQSCYIVGLVCLMSENIRDLSRISRINKNCHHLLQERRFWRFCVRFGDISNRNRAYFWEQCASVTSTRAISEFEYQTYNEMARSKGECTDLITTDVRRTYGIVAPHKRASESSTEEKLHADEELVNQLSDVLHALSSRFPNVGYCQGMDYIAAFVIDIVKESTNLVSETISSAQTYLQAATNEQVERAFWILVCLFEQYGLQDMFSPGLHQLNSQCFIFKRLFELTMPTLAQHFDKENIMAEMFVVGWFQTLFLYLNVLPRRTLTRIWDIFLWEKNWKIITRATLALFQVAATFVETESIDCVIRFFNTFDGKAEELLESEAFIVKAQSFKVTNSQLLRLQRQYVKKLPAQMSSNFNGDNFEVVWYTTVQIVNLIGGTREYLEWIGSGGSKMRSIDLILSASYVVPVVPRGAIYTDYSVVIEKGRIIDLIPTSLVLEKYIPTQHIELPNRILLPGLINSHSHAALNLLRGISDDKTLFNWLTEDIWPTEAKFVGREFLETGVEHAIAEMLRGGTTCFNDMYFLDTTAQVVERCQMRAMLGNPILEFASAYGSDARQYLNTATRSLKDAQKRDKRDLIQYSIAPHAPYTVSDASFSEVKKISERFQVPIHLHLHETKMECDDSESLTKSMSCHQSQKKLRPVANLIRLGLLSRRLIAVHMTQLTELEMDQIAEAQVNVIHCPTSNLKLASGICPVEKLLEKGVNIALGTDSAASNNTLDMFAEIKLAAILAKIKSGTCTSVPATIALEMATINGAKALGMEEEIGSIEIGKSADIIAIAFDSIEMLPMYNPISHITYVAGREQVTDVWIQGSRMLQERALITIDEEQLKFKIKCWQENIKHHHELLEQQRLT